MNTSYKSLFTCMVLSVAGYLCASAVSINDVLHEIETNNPELHAMTASNAAEEMELRAENTLAPTSIEYSPFFRSGVSGIASSELIVSQEFDFPTRYAARSRQAKLERKALDGAARVRRQEILAEAKETLLEIILLRETEEIMNNRLTDTKALLTAYENALGLGEATLLEVNKVKLESLDLEREILENRSAMAAAVSAITRLNANRRPDLEGLRYEMPASELMLPSDPSTVVMGDAAIGAAAAGVEAAKNGLKVANGGWLPGLTVGYRRNTEEHQASNGFLVGAALPIFSNSAKTKAAEARLTSSMLEMETAAMNAEAEYMAYTVTFERQKEILATYDLSLVKETLGLYGKSLAAGQINLTTYYTEVNTLYDSLLTYLRLENDLQRTYSRLTSPLL